jgi:hypothetical protein
MLLLRRDHHGRTPTPSALSARSAANAWITGPKMCADRDIVTVVGHAAAISAGEWITTSGEWIALIHIMLRRLAATAS